MNWEEDDTFLAKWLSGELSDEERSAFEASPEGKEYIKMIEASKMIQPPSYDAEAALLKLQARIEADKPKETKVVPMFPIYKLAAAASVLFILGISIFLMTGTKSIETSFMQQELVALPDGSEVQLNATSTLAFSKRSFEEDRQLELAGEAFFKVEKGSTFTVSTHNGSVEVLGTSFNVKSRNNRLEVVCYTGKVRVSAEHATKDLLKGDRVVIQDGELVNFEHSPVASNPSWMDGIIELDNVSLRDAIIELEANYGVQVELDKSLDNLRYTGSLPKGNVETALKLVFDPLGLAYTFDEDTKTVAVTEQ